MCGGCAQEGFKSQSGHHGQFVQEDVSLVPTVGHLNSKSFFTEANGRLLGILSRWNGPDYGFQTFWTAIYTKKCISHSYPHTF